MTNLPVISQHIPIVDKHGRASFEMRCFWNAFLEYLQKNIEDTVDAALTAAWSQVTDDDGNKPEDNATVGADWPTNLTSRPAELTDGRISAALGSDGIIIAPTNLPPTSSAGGRYQSTGAITWQTITSGANVYNQIDIAAGNLIVGTSIAYNAMSVSSSVHAPTGSTTTYYFYVDTNIYTAGAHTVHMTSTLSSIFGISSRAYIGKADVVDTGGQSGSGDSAIDKVVT